MIHLFFWYMIILFIFLNIQTIIFDITSPIVTDVMLDNGRCWLGKLNPSIKLGIGYFVNICYNDG